MVAAAAINVAIFFRAPLYFSYREVRRAEQELTAALNAVRQIASPEETIIVGFDSHFLGYRHAGYYLPEYLTIQFPEVPLASTTGVFAMRHQDTRLVSRLRVGSFRNFLLFPLPSSDKEYLEYMQRIRARFPPGDVACHRSERSRVPDWPGKCSPCAVPSTRLALEPMTR